jgi:virulence factor Mce-like protein
MRRAAVIVSCALVVALIAWLATAGGSSGYRFAAIFDNARGMVPGQQVKIAGAVVGTLDAVQLTSNLDARIVMTIDGRFAPLSADASCSILPEGLISENFVQCDPGRSRAPLGRGPGGIPVVPLAHTTVPFSVQDLLNVFALPTDERLRVLITELGIATSGRGQDLNGLLLRADPALEQSRRVLSIIDAQRSQLTTAVGQTNAVLAQLAGRGSQVRAFVDNTADVVNTTAVHSGALGEAIARLPAMLRAVRPGLASLHRATANATPLLSDLHAAAPGLDKLTSVLPAFANAGVPALRALSSTTARAVPIVHAAAPFVSHLLAASDPLRTLATDLDRLLVSVRGDGALEGTLRLTYEFAVESSLYDNTSHIATFLFNIAPNCILGDLAGDTVRGCAHSYSSAGEGELPINEPSCGAKSGAWFDEFCPAVAPSPVTLARGSGHQKEARELVTAALSGHTPSPAQVRPLLQYLLK